MSVCVREWVNERALLNAFGLRKGAENSATTRVGERGWGGGGAGKCYIYIFKRVLISWVPA